MLWLEHFSMMSMTGLGATCEIHEDVDAAGPGLRNSEEFSPSASNELSPHRDYS